MKIAIDGNEANVKKRVGSGQYTFNILKQWSMEPGHDFHIYLKNLPLGDMPSETKKWHYHIVGPKRMWLRFALPLNFILSRARFDVFFSPAHYSPIWVPAPLVVTIHDLAYEYFEDQFLKKDIYKLKNWTAQSVRKAKKIIAVSQNTKRDILKKYNLSPDEVTVIPNGFNNERFHQRVKPLQSILSKYQIPATNYILYVGTIQPRKNVKTLVQAFHILKKQNKYHGKLVIAGNEGWMADASIQTIRQSRYASDIIITGYIDHSDLPTLYKGADIYVLPSLYEGFGIPAVEAMATGTPVAVSDNSSLPEVVGNAGGLFDPNDPADIANTIMQTLEKKDHYIKRGFKQASKFSWNNTAAKTLDTLINSSSN